MKGTSKPRLPHLRPAHPHLRVRGWFLSENAAMPPGQQVKVHKSASFVDIMEVCKFTTFCDRKGYTRKLGCEREGLSVIGYHRPSERRRCVRDLVSAKQTCGLSWQLRNRLRNNHIPVTQVYDTWFT